MRREGTRAWERKVEVNRGGGIHVGEQRRKETRTWERRVEERGAEE